MGWIVVRMKDMKKVLGPAPWSVARQYVNEHEGRENRRLGIKSGSADWRIFYDIYDEAEWAEMVRRATPAPWMGDANHA